MIGEDGRITLEAPERFQGLTVADAQRRVVAELGEQGLIARTEPYEHTVPFSQRSGERIEPLISLQWFMAMEELAAPAIEAVTSGRIRFHPANQAKVYLDWMENIRPWCICRQLWWGHQLPVWYRDLDDLRGHRAAEGEGWQRDPDVLDTWFSSALWPFATLGWPEDTPELRAFYPTDALVTARDIIFLWVARMIMMGLEFTGEIPFSDVHIHSIIQAPDGRRMSKSLGTGIDPLDLIEGGPRPPVFARGGTRRLPGLRRRRAALGAAGHVLRPGRPLQRGQGRPGPAADQQALERRAADPARRGRRTRAPAWRPTPSRIGGSCRAWSGPGPRWRRGSRRFDFSHAALALYDFVYGELCDWYLELVKPRLRAGEPELAGDAAARADRDGGAGPPADPVRDRGDLLATSPGAEGLLAARRRAPPARRRRRAAPRRRCSGPSRRSRRCAAGGLGRGRGRRECSAPGWRRPGYDETARAYRRGWPG